MAIATKNTVFYHIPKTGGIWVKSAMRFSGVPYGRVRNGLPHPYGLYREHSTPVGIEKSVEGKLSFCFVRHPVDWYRSYWAYRYKTDALDPKFPLDKLYRKNFQKFVNNVLEAYPEGFVGNLYRFYVDSDLSGVDFIGKQERLEQDLIFVLRKAGETFDEKVIRKTKWRNIAASSKKFRHLCIPDKDLRERIIKTERWVCENFNYA